MKKPPAPPLLPGTAFHPGLMSFSDDMLFELMARQEELITRRLPGALPSHDQADFPVVEST